jgi:hypothetical protein
MKKIAVIGRGTAGVLAVAHFWRWAKDCEVELYFDTNIKPQPVGEGSTLVMPKSLAFDLGFTYEDLHNIDGTFKYGIKKQNWANGGTFMHQFVPPSVSYHFNAGKLQDYIINILKDQVKIIDKNVTPEDIDADFVMDCSGKPQDYSEFNMSEFIPVNSVHVTQCYWDYPRFQYTLTIARPYGWVFGIPLQNRCSIGYLYNNTINTLEEVKADVEEIFKEYNLTPSEHTNTFSFKNYSRKANFTKRVAYNGNSSFFLEPIEATSIATMDAVNRRAFDVWFNGKQLAEANIEYRTLLAEVENVIMLHYFAGSIFKTPFWEYAASRGRRNMASAFYNPAFTNMLNYSQQDIRDLYTFNSGLEYGTWSGSSFQQNLICLGLYDKLRDLHAEIGGKLDANAA